MGPVRAVLNLPSKVSGLIYFEYIPLSSLAWSDVCDKPESLYNTDPSRSRTVLIELAKVEFDARK